VRHGAVVAIGVCGSLAVVHGRRVALLSDQSIAVTVVPDGKTQAGGVNVPVAPDEERTEAGLG
jgi:acyl-CoA synthetase (AMP-forming)/AMP-acid ligase II